MELFSKRYNARKLRRFVFGRDTDNNNFIGSETLKKRLQEEMKYVVKSNNFLESFLVVDNERLDLYYLEKDTLRDLSLRELGYDLTEILIPEKFDFDLESYSDIRFFDLLELIIIFCRKDKRQELINRLQQIFDEEDTEFVIHDFMIFTKRATGLQSIVPLVKDRLLKSMLEKFFSNLSARDSYTHETRAKLSAEILQNIFSSPKSKKETKSYTSKLCKEVAGKWTDKEYVAELSELLSKTILNAKALNNQIGNIRHTDQHTIPIDNPDFYKLITQKNIALIELVILSSPNKYISTQDPEELKNGYLARYSIDKSTTWTIKVKKNDVETIDIEDIPF